MMDPIVEEVRKARLEHTLKFNSDLVAICSDLRSIQRTSGHPVVSLAQPAAGKCTKKDSAEIR